MTRVYKIGDDVRSIETGWTGRVMSKEDQDGVEMLVCNHFSGGKIEKDDKRWFSPEDVRLARSLAQRKLNIRRNANRALRFRNPLNTHMDLVRNGTDELPSVLTDMLTDMMHFCYQTGIDIDEQIRIAKDHFSTELSEAW